MSDLALNDSGDLALTGSGESGYPANVSGTVIVVHPVDIDPAVYMTGVLGDDGPIWSTYRDIVLGGRTFKIAGAPFSPHPWQTDLPVFASRDTGAAVDASWELPQFTETTVSIPSLPARYTEGPPNTATVMAPGLLYDPGVAADPSSLGLVYDEAYVRQSLEIRLKHFQGEWFRDQNAGTDWHGRILGKASDLARRAELRRRILSAPRVAALTRLDLELDSRTRALGIEFEVQLDSGLPLEVRFEVTV